MQLERYAALRSLISQTRNVRPILHSKVRQGDCVSAKVRAVVDFTPQEWGS